MMTHELEVSIVAAPLEAIDRRVLSQAWYSALHLAASAPPARNHTTVQRGSVAMRPPVCGRAPSRTSDAATPHFGQRCTVRSIRRAEYVSDAPQPRRPPQSRLAARIERTFADTSLPRRATFSLGRGNARVHVVLQTTPTRTMLIALCRPELRADVGRALAQARAGLSARGIALDLRKLGGRACS
jgi:hypothetical protein